MKPRRPAPIQSLDSIMLGKSANKVIRTMYRQLKDYESYAEYLESKVEECRYSFQDVITLIGGSMRIEEFHSDRSILKIDWIFVEPEFRRSGTGSKLLNIAKDIGKEMGFKKIIAIPASDSSQGCLPLVDLRGFYTSSGFLVCDNGYGSEYYEMILE